MKSAHQWQLDSITHESAAVLIQLDTLIHAAKLCEQRKDAMNAIAGNNGIGGAIGVAVDDAYIRACDECILFIKAEIDKIKEQYGIPIDFPE